MIGYKRWFYRGLAALLPTLVTLVILVYLGSFINQNFGKYIGWGITQGAGRIWPQWLTPSQQIVDSYLKAQNKTISTVGESDYKKYSIQASQDIRQRRLDELGKSWFMVLIGFILALILVTILGLFLASFIGRTLWQALESTIIRVPVVRQIYPYVKQVTDYFLGQAKLDFSKVVAVQYPRTGIWSLGFVTGPAIEAIQKADKQDREHVTIFIPTSPPFTGYVITVMKDELVDLPLTMDQALRFLISGGVIRPEIAFKSADKENRQMEHGKVGLQSLK